MFNFYEKNDTVCNKFFMAPKSLYMDERYNKLSLEAKFTYVLMLDRLSLSLKNKWYDKEKHAFIVYPIRSLMKDLRCGKTKVFRILNELTQFRLIIRKRNGAKLPNIIYPLKILQNNLRMTKEQSDVPKSHNKEAKGMPENLRKSLYLKLNIPYPKHHSERSSEGIKDEIYKDEHHRQNAQNTRQNSIGNYTKQNILDCEHPKNKGFEVSQHEHPSTTESNAHSSDKIDTECTNNDIKAGIYLDKNASDFTKLGKNTDIHNLPNSMTTLKKQTKYDVLVTMYPEHKDTIEQIYQVLFDLFCGTKKKISYIISGKIVPIKDMLQTLSNVQYQDILSVLQVVVGKDLLDPPKYILSCLYNNRTKNYNPGFQNQMNENTPTKPFHNFKNRSNLHLIIDELERNALGV